MERSGPQSGTSGGPCLLYPLELLKSCSDLQLLMFFIVSYI